MSGLPIRHYRTEALVKATLWAREHLSNVRFSFVNVLEFRDACRREMAKIHAETEAAKNAHEEEFKAEVKKLEEGANAKKRARQATVQPRIDRLNAEIARLRDEIERLQEPVDSYAKEVDVAFYREKFEKEQAKKYECSIAARAGRQKLQQLQAEMEHPRAACAFIESVVAADGRVFEHKDAPFPKLLALRRAYLAEWLKEASQYKGKDIAQVKPEKPDAKSRPEEIKIAEYLEAGSLEYHFATLVAAGLTPPQIRHSAWVFTIHKYQTLIGTDAFRVSHDWRLNSEE